MIVSLDQFRRGRYLKGLFIESPRIPRPDLLLSRGSKGAYPGIQTLIAPVEPDVLGDGDGVGGALGEVVWRRVYRGFRNCRFLG